MKNCYINGVGSVSAQETSDYETFLENYKEITTNITTVCKPNYRDFIKPNRIRRMASGVKNGVVAAKIALTEANLDSPDAIITGTGMGCTIDSEKFLKNIVANDEQFLTPTSFIQSTHNTVGGQIALSLQCNAYNVTYVHNATSFETSIIDAMLMLNDDASKILVGAVDEIGKQTTEFYKEAKIVKPEEIIFKDGLLNSKTKGTSLSEGAHFFVLENEKTTNTYAKIKAVEIYDILEENKIEEKIHQFLKDNQLDIDTIDAVILGNNGNVEFDCIFNNLQNGIFKHTQQLYYKHLSGEYYTANGFGLYLASNILKNQEIPEIVKINHKENKSLKHILLYNQYRGEEHSFILLSSC